MKEVYPWDLWEKNPNGIQFWKPPLSRKKKESRRRLRYGFGILGGVVVVDFLKKSIRNIPVVGSVLSPVLAFVPSLLLGAALGAAAVYGYEEGDALAAARLIPGAQEELARVSSTVERHLEEKHDRLASGMRRLHRKAQGHLDNAADDMAADMEHQMRQVSRSLDVDSVIGRLERGLDESLQQLSSGGSNVDSRGIGRRTA